MSRSSWRACSNDDRVPSADNGRHDGENRSRRRSVDRLPGLPRGLDVSASVEDRACCATSSVRQRGRAPMGISPGRGDRVPVHSRRARPSRVDAGACLPSFYGVVPLRGNGADQGLAPRDDASGILLPQHLERRPTSAADVTLN